MIAPFILGLWQCSLWLFVCACSPSPNTNSARSQVSNNFWLKASESAFPNLSCKMFKINKSHLKLQFSESGNSHIQEQDGYTWIERCNQDPHMPSPCHRTRCPAGRK